MDSSDNGALRPEVIDRADLPRGFLNTAWPLLAAALILLMLLRACVPAAPPAPPPFDAATATRQANAAALAALRVLPAQPAMPDVIAALNLGVINFGSGSDVIPGNAAGLLQQAAQAIGRLPAESKLVIVGHTDNIGDTAANQALSLRRAEAVRAALVERGAAAAMLASEGRGDAQPVADNNSEAGRFRNRRIEFAPAP